MRYILLILVFALVGGCSSPATIEPAREPTKPPTIEIILDTTTPTLTIAPTATDQPTITATATNMSSREYLETANRGVELLFADITDALPIIQNAVDTGTMDALRLKSIIDSIASVSESLCALKPPAEYVDLHANLSQVCVRANELQTAYEKGLTGSVTTGDFVTPFAAIAKNLSKYIDVTKAMGLSSPDIQPKITVIPTVRSAATMPKATRPPTKAPPTRAPLTATPTAITAQPTATQTRVSGGYVCPDGTACIKGNINDGKKLYHFPGCPSYNATKIDTSKGERWFTTTAEAEAAGWTRAGNCPR